MTYPDTKREVTLALSRLSAAQDVGWLLLVILLPLWVNLGGQQPFELPKVALFRSLVWLLAAVALLEHIGAGRAPWRVFGRNPLLTAVTLLALVLITTTATAVDWRLSLWGSYEWQQGAITQLSYLLLFVLAAGRFHVVERVRPLLASMVATGGLIALLGLGQAVGWNPAGLISDARSPLYATLGRANFVGAYLALLLPLTLALFLTASHRYGRLTWAAVGIAQLVVIGLSEARGAWLATAVALLLFLLLWPDSPLNHWWRKLAWASVGLLVASGPAAVWLSQQPTGSTAARGHIWHGAMQLIGQRPWLGHGADSMGLLFPTVYPPALVYAQGRDFFVDRAHNIFLDWAVVAGLLGLFAFGLVLGLFCWVVGKALARPQIGSEQLFLAAMVAAVVGNLTHNLVSFDTTSTAMATWLLMGMAVAQAAPFAEVEREAGTTPRPFRKWALTGLELGLLAVAVWQANGRLLWADTAARTAQHHLQAGAWEPATAAAQQAITYWPTEPTYHLLLSQTQWEQAVANPTEASLWLSQAEASLTAARQLRPCEANLWWRTAQFHASAAHQFGLDSWHRADEAYRRAAECAPYQAALYADWGRFHLEAGDPASAVPLLRHALALDASHHQAQQTLHRAELALGHLTSGD